MNLLRAGRIFVFEPPPGVKANMLRTFSGIPVSRMCKVSLTLQRPSRTRAVPVVAVKFSCVGHSIQQSLLGLGPTFSHTVGCHSSANSLGCMASDLLLIAVILCKFYYGAL